MIHEVTPSTLYVVAIFGKHILFCFQMDDGSGCRPCSVLCMPIQSSHNEMVGVIQLVDKLDGQTFNETDEKILEVS